MDILFPARVGINDRESILFGMTDTLNGATLSSVYASAVFLPTNDKSKKSLMKLVEIFLFLEVDLIHRFINISKK